MGEIAARSWGYRLRFRLADLGLRAALTVLPRVPAALLEALGELAWRASYRIQRRRVARMEAGVALALGDALPDPEARRAVVRESWRHMVRSVLEAGLAVTHHSRRERMTRLPIEGEEHLTAALARGRGVLVLSAHLGAFTAVPIRLAAEHAVSLVANRPDDDRAADFLDACRARVGMGSVPVRPARAAVRASLEALAENRLLVILADEFKAGGVAVEFFGRPASAARGPVTLALRSGAPLLPVFARREPGDRITLEVGPEIELERSGHPTEDVARNTQRVCDVIEQRIRRSPEQWYWANFRAESRLAARKFQTRGFAPDAGTAQP